jgi:dihydrofolate reductase
VTASALIYMSIASLDGYIEDRGGGFEWAAPDDEVHAFVNDLLRPVGCHLYGRRLYETMAVWETDDFWRDSEITRDFAEVWQRADKIVFSTTLSEVSTSRTRIERRFDPDAVGRLKASTSGDLTIGGPHLAAQALAAGLVDEYHLLIAPVVVGGGKPSLPDDLRLDLDLLDERRFAASGVVYLRYRIS